MVRWEGGQGRGRQASEQSRRARRDSAAGQRRRRQARTSAQAHKRTYAVQYYARRELRETSVWTGGWRLGGCAACLLLVASPSHHCLPCLCLASLRRPTTRDNEETRRSRRPTRPDFVDHNSPLSPYLTTTTTTHPIHRRDRALSHPPSLHPLLRPSPDLASPSPSRSLPPSRPYS